jgi:hypothetical protein
MPAGLLGQICSACHGGTSIYNTPFAIPAPAPTSPADSNSSLRPFNPELFGWVSYEKELGVRGKTKKGTSLHAAAGLETILIAGENSTGPFTADVLAEALTVGGEGTKRSAYAGVFGGWENVTQYTSSGEEPTFEREPIILVEGGFGLTVAGAYQTGFHGEDTGLYFGLRAGPYAAIGIGFNIDFFLFFLGTFGPPQTDNPWFQGPGGIPIGAEKR